MENCFIEKHLMLFRIKKINIDHVSFIINEWISQNCNFQLFPSHHINITGNKKRKRAITHIPKYPPNILPKNNNIPNRKTFTFLEKNRSSILDIADRGGIKSSLGFILHARTFTRCARRCRRRDASRRRASLAPAPSSPPVFRPLNPARGIKGKIYGGVAACSRPNGDDPRSSSLVLARAISRIRSARAAEESIATTFRFPRQNGNQNTAGYRETAAILFNDRAVSNFRRDRPLPRMNSSRRGSWTCVEEKERHFFFFFFFFWCTRMFGEKWRKFGARKIGGLIGWWSFGLGAASLWDHPWVSLKFFFFLFRFRISLDERVESFFFWKGEGYIQCI